MIDHPYLIKKQLRDSYGARIGDWRRTIQDSNGKHQALVIKRTLLLPMFNQHGELRNLQGIFPEVHPLLGRDKDFLAGGQLSGCFWWVGPKTQDKVLICEGFATAATLYEETKYRTYVAFSAGNLLAIGRIIREKLPDAEIVFCADNDTETEGNPGVTKGTEAALAVGGSVAIPPIDDADFNDYHIFLKGLENDQWPK